MNDTSGPIIQLISSLGASGVLAWYCWYVTTHTLPRLVSEFREESRLIRAESESWKSHSDQQVERLSKAVETMVEHCKRGQDHAIAKTQTS